MTEIARLAKNRREELRTTVERYRGVDIRICALGIPLKTATSALGARDWPSAWSTSTSFAPHSMLLTRTSISAATLPPALKGQ